MVSMCCSRLISEDDDSQILKDLLLKKYQVCQVSKNKYSLAGGEVVEILTFSKVQRPEMRGGPKCTFFFN